MSAAQTAKSVHTVGFIPVTTFVLWTGCMIVGGLGYTLHYTRPQPLVSIPPVTAEKITVELDNSPQLIASTPDKPSAKLTTPPPAPSLAMASPSPLLAFPLPVSGPVRTGTLSQTTSSTQKDPKGKNGSIERLVFGQGAGRQAKPPYPSTAIRLGQEGIVTIRLSVGKDGDVTTAEVSAPSPWPLLNETAVHTVRERWHFPPGAPRAYEVAIRFTLQK